MALSGDSLRVRTPFAQEKCGIDDLIDVEYKKPSFFTNGCLRITTESNAYPVYFASRTAAKDFKDLYDDLSSRLSTRAKGAVMQPVIGRTPEPFVLSYVGTHPMLSGKGRMKVYVLDDALRLDYRGTDLGTTVRYEDIRALSAVDRCGGETEYLVSSMAGSARWLLTNLSAVIIECAIHGDARYRIELKGRRSSEFFDYLLSQMTKHQDDRQSAE